MFGVRAARETAAEMQKDVDVRFQGFQAFPGAMFGLSFGGRGLGGFPALMLLVKAGG